MNAQATNLSGRGFVGTGNDVLIGGIIVGGPTGSMQRVLVRALGPTLGSAGVASPLANPTLSLRDANGNVIANNDNWQDSQQARYCGNRQGTAEHEGVGHPRSFGSGELHRHRDGEEWNYRRWVDRILQFTLNRKSTTQRGRIGVDIL